MQKIVPFLWFDDQAEEAARFYISVFPDSKLGRISHYPKSTESASGKPAGSVMLVEFELFGQKFVAINGGPDFKLSEAVSFVINCDSQEEVDYYWEKLGEGGDPEAQICGWLKDKFGLSWQITPTVLTEMINDKDREKVDRVMAAMLKMKKIDIAELNRAAVGRE